MKAWESGRLTMALAAGAVLVWGLVLLGEIRGGAEFEAPEPVELQGWPEIAITGSPAAPESAAVYLVIFENFLCPFSAEIRSDVRQLRELHRSRLVITHKHFANAALQPTAYQAALAAECATEQGRGESFRDALYTRQAAIGRISWEEYAETALVPDVGRFSTCIRDREYGERIEADRQLALANGIDGTPIMVVDNLLFSGARTIHAVKREVERRMLEHTSQR